MSTKMSTSKMSTLKKNINVDEAVKTRTKRKHISKIEDETLLQRIKEKQLLKQWKLARTAGKKTRSIVRCQSRDVTANVKQQFSERDESEYELCGAVKDYYVWKHAGCNAECKADDCQQWMLDYLYFEMA